MKKPKIIILNFLVAIAVLAAAIFFLWGRISSFNIASSEMAFREDPTYRVVTSPIQEGPRVKIGSIIIPVELAQTDIEIHKGLSGRPSLDEGGGMLFLFSKPDIYRFWMPDMHFPIDIIWISDWKVIDISADVSDDFDSANPRFYTSKVPAQYVIEVNAGFSKKTGIRVGDAVVFSDVDYDH